MQNLTCIWDVSGSHYPPDLLHALEVWREAAVAAKYLLVNDCGYRQAVEAVCECLPQLYVVSAFALIIET